MITSLHRIFVASIPFFILHGIEEYFTGFFRIDPIFLWVFRPILDMPTDQASFIVFQVMVWLLLIVSVFLLFGNHWHCRLLLIPGILYLFETHHLIEAALRREYYSGSFTAIVFPIFAFLFWREFIRLHKSRHCDHF